MTQMKTKTKTKTQLCGRDEKGQNETFGFICFGVRV